MFSLRWVATGSLAACSGAPTTPPQPPPPVATAVDAAVAIGGPVDASEPISPELAAAPAFVFRYYQTGKATPERIETWTLRRHGDHALVIVERRASAAATTTSTTRYIGTGDGEKLTLAAGANQLALTCKPGKLAIAGATAVRQRHPAGKFKPCQDPGRWAPDATKTIDVLNCFHPDFAAPMVFAAAPGVEFVQVDDECEMKGGGYRAIGSDGALAPVR